MKSVGFIAEGTVCPNCEKIIIRQAKRISGVDAVTFDIVSETGVVTFDEQKTDMDTILDSIEEKGYSCYILDDAPRKSRFHPGWIVAVIGFLIAGYFVLQLAHTIELPAISQNMGYGLLFVVGLLTGFHCISMCGGFVVSYTADDSKKGRKSHVSHILYGSGKLISYTVIGAAFGLIGSIIAFTAMMRGVVGVLAGIFLILFGLRMLNILPFLRRVQIKPPSFITRFVGKRSAHAGPLVVGLLNGLMIACGPLQAIYIMAAGTGSLLEGAKLLFVFGLGTLPVMIGFGYFASFVSGHLTQKILKASGVIVILLGIIMANNGLVLTGSGYDIMSIIPSAAAAGSEVKIEDGVQEIRMEVTRYGWEPDTFVLKRGVPVRWIIDGKEINGCNNAIQVPAYDLDFDIGSGEQVIEFTPDEEGVIRWSCWMGMIPGTFIVKDDVDLDDGEAVQKEIAAVPEAPRGSCGGSCGGSSCGAAQGSTCGCGR